MAAGYSPRSQAQKLGVKPDSRVLVHDRPAGWRWEADPAIQVAEGECDVALAFIRSADGIVPAVEAIAPGIWPAGALWMLWPRRAAGHESDVTENLIREAALTRGLVDVKVAAVDEDWSGLKIVWRTENRAERTAF